MSDARKPAPRPVELTEADERALDALLSEAINHRGAARDFTASVLARLPRGPVNRPRPDNPRRSQRRSGSSWVIAAAVAALAASVLAILLSRGALDQAGQVDQVAQVAQPTTDSAAERAPRRDAMAGSAATPQRPLPSAPPSGGAAPDSAAPRVATAKPPRKPPVVLSEAAADGGAVTGGTAEVAADLQTPSARNPQAGALATESTLRSVGENAQLADFNRQFAIYWQAIGVTPAPVIDQSAWLDRIADRFGWRPSRGGESPRVQEAFSDPEASRELAQRLVDQLVVGLKPSPERREQLVQEATAVIANGGRFDRWLSSWVIQEAALTQASETLAQDAALASEWMASRVIGAEMGCARCHDSPLDSQHVQHDLWAMAALLSPPSAPELFYELPDGRQRLATPGVPTRWFDTPDPAEPAAELSSREQLPGLIIGSPQIARTLANHLWTIGFGAPLVAATSSPLAPPRDDALDQALTMLADHLLSENFDVRAAAKWVISCDPMKRGVPAEFIGDRWQVASESELAAASLAQRAFAAAKVTVPQAGREQLLAMMQTRGGLIPATLAAPDSLLAQPRPQSPQQPVQTAYPQPTPPSGSAPQQPEGPEIKVADLEDFWWAQWLADREGLQGGWLDSIRNPDQQLRHAFYAAGYREIDPEQLQKAETLLATTQQSQQDRAETIAQIHWILQNSK